MLIAGATAYSYWVLTSNLDREDDEFVGSRVEDVESRLRDEPTGLSSLMNLWKEPSTAPSLLHVVIRVLKSDGTMLAAMHGSDVVPWPLADFRGSLETEGSAGEWRCLGQDAALASGDAIIIQAALDRRHCRYSERGSSGNHGRNELASWLDRIAVTSKVLPYLQSITICG